MEKIWKYTLEVIDTQTLRMPAGAKVLSVANQNGELCLWAMVNPVHGLVKRVVQVVGTGNPMPKDLGVFVGTVVINPFVWHVFVDV